MKRMKTDYPVEGLNLESLMETLFYREEFLSIASHELKTPLTSIRLQAQVFKRKKNYSKENVDRLVEQIDSQSTRIMKLIDDMLDVARIRSNQFRMTKAPVDLSEILKEVIHKLPVTSQIDSHINMHGDRDRIFQMFHILIQNACRYGNGSPVVVRLGVKKNKIVFSVKDQGPGISPEDQKRIFHRFQRAIAASEMSGLGLGLFLAREIAEAHHGKIKVKSKLGEGATFSVDFTPVQENE